MKRQNTQGSIRKRGLHCWEGCVMVDERRHYVYGKTYQDVQKQISTIALKAELGLLVCESDLPLSEWLEQWITSYVNVKDNTLVRYQEDITQHISPAIGKICLCNLRTGHIQQFYNKKLKDGMSPKSLRNLHGVLHEALERAVLTDLIAKNPSNACVLPKVRQAEMHPLVGAEIGRFLDEIKCDPYADLYYVSLFTGMRQGEALGLTWDSILFDCGVIHLQHQLQKERKKGGGHHLVALKNSEDRYVQPAPQVLDVLKRIKAAQDIMKRTSGNTWNNDMGLVFVNAQGGHLTKVTTYNHLKVIARRMGKPELRFHDLRHTYATLSLQTGANIKTVSSQLGHATTAFTLDRYGHTTDPMRKDAADRMSAFIREITDET